MIDLRKAFFPQNTSVSTLQLKGGWGVSGLEKYVPYELFGNYLSSSWFEPEKGTTTFYDGLDKLRTSEWTIGLEMGFLSDRIMFGAGFYDRSTDDIFVMYQLGRLPEGATDNYWVWGGCDKVFERKSIIRNQGVEFDLSAASEKSIGEIDSYGLLQVSALLSCISRSAASSAAAETAEHIEYIIEIDSARSAETAEISEASESACSAAVAWIYSGMAELVIPALFVRIGEYLVSLIDFFEFLLGRFVVRVAVRVIFHSQLAVCFFYLIL
jgi:hypothetical protein